jgi:hypothetical protein
VRRAVAGAALALVLGGCAGGATSNGFSVKAPPGWRDATETAETKTKAEFEAVFEGTSVEGIAPTIAISRSDGRKDPGLQRATELARKAVLAAFGPESKPTSLAGERLGDEPALRFDYRAGDKRARYLQAKRGDRLYALTLESAPESFDRMLAILRGVQGSWRWQEDG